MNKKSLFTLRIFLLTLGSVVAQTDRTLNTAIAEKFEIKDWKPVIDLIKNDLGVFKKSSLTFSETDITKSMEAGQRLYFENIYASYFGDAAAAQKKLKLLFKQWDVGSPPTKPYLAQLAFLSCKQNNDFTWLALPVDPSAKSGTTYYDVIVKNVERYFETCDTNKNGLPTWTPESNLESVELAALLFRELSNLSDLANQLLKLKERTQFKERAVALGQKIHEHFYDPENSFFYDKDQKTGKFDEKMHVGAFLTLLNGNATDAQVKRLVDTHIVSDSGFAHDLISKKTMLTDLHILDAYTLMQGLLHYGYRDLAEQATRKQLRTALTDQSTDTFDFRALAIAMLYDYELNFDPTTLYWQSMIAIFPDYLAVPFNTEQL